MSEKTRKKEIPAIVPAVRQIRLFEGETQLSSDVRLVTLNVFPFVRKTMRTVFSSSGVRVVANKKSFVINVQVVEPSEIEMSDVPESLRDDYYEIDIVNNEVTVRTATQSGAVWGSQTFGHIFKALGGDVIVQNCRIRDWPAKKIRGIFFETCWGMESLLPEDWAAVMDRLVRSKLNTFGVMLVGAVQKPDGAGLIDIMLPQVEALAPMQTPVQLKYYSPQNKKWLDEPALPRVFEMETASKIFTLAREKGLNSIIGFNAPSFARILGNGDIRAMDDDEFRQKTTALLDYAAEKCMHKTNPYFLLSLDNFNSTEEKQTHAVSPAVAGGFVDWFAKEISQRNLGRLLLWLDNFTGADAVADTACLEALAKTEGAANIILGCRASQPDDDEKAAIARLQKLGIEVWNVASSCTLNWVRHETCYDKIAVAGELTHEAPVGGVLADAIYDPAWVDHGQLLACHTWNPEAAGSIQELLEQGIKIRFGELTDIYEDAMGKLSAAINENPTIQLCFNTGAPDYPQRNIDELKTNSNAAAEMKNAQKLAKDALDQFKILAAKPKEELNDYLAKAAGSLAGEAARIEALAGCFAELLKPDNKKEKGKKALLVGMKNMEKFKPRFLAPAALANLTPLVEFLEK